MKTKRTAQLNKQGVLSVVCFLMSLLGFILSIFWFTDEFFVIPMLSAAVLIIAVIGVISGVMSNSNYLKKTGLFGNIAVIAAFTIHAFI
ncbi:hypothetical protein GKZ89_09095 [Bacillus mangrovi]|uniref:Uncharacterized protein n=1 Tax=Metabacillus mangrovi TaxID=1491830 RepID=A0A7X2S533_9BACI|nr:hypothetical protein [Metabacillus mangrovi]MTH53557.1 hypothetical protein [Metabacillus mangrovi]